jgi:hypothetical protein
MTSSDSRNDNDVSYRHAFPNIDAGSAISGIASHGPNGPLNPVRGRDLMIMSRISLCFSVISSSFGPLYRGSILDDVLLVLLLIVLLLFVVIVVNTDFCDFVVVVVVVVVGYRIAVKINGDDNQIPTDEKRVISSEQIRVMNERLQTTVNNIITKIKDS